MISPPQQNFRLSVEYLKHKHEHWNTIASDYSYLGNYYTSDDNFRITRTCISSLANGVNIVNENSRCLCWNGSDMTEVTVNPHGPNQRYCRLPQELNIENILIPYYKPYDNRRQYNIVFHGWAARETPQKKTDRPAGNPLIGSRLCVRKINQSILDDETTCPNNDMRSYITYRTKARRQGILHHVIVQEFSKNSNTTTKSTMMPTLQKSEEQSNCPIQTPPRQSCSRLDGVTVSLPPHQLKSDSTKSSAKRKMPLFKNGISKLVKNGDGARLGQSRGTKTEQEELLRRLQFGNTYSVYNGLPKSSAAEDRWDRGYWKIEAERAGSLPRWITQYTTHIPIDFPGNIKSYGTVFMDDNWEGINVLAARIGVMRKSTAPFMAYNNTVVLPKTYRLCFLGEVVTQDSLQQQPTNTYDPSLPLCTLRLPRLLPSILEEAGMNTYRRSVLYDHAMHMVVKEGDTVWTGNVSYKPGLSSYTYITQWKETPLREVTLKPGIYRWTPFRLGMETVYNDVRQVEKFTEACHGCRYLFNQCEKASTYITNDHTPHFYLMHTKITSGHRSNKQEVFETVTPVHRQLNKNFDMLVHIWASDREEFLNCGVDMPFNWWNKVDKNLEPIKMWWPQSRMTRPFSLEVPLLDRFEPEKTPYLLNDIDLRGQLFGTATKLIIKNPVTFFNRRLISVEICSGGTRGGGYTLLDEDSLEVVGAILLDVLGDDREVYECHHHNGDNDKNGSRCQAQDGDPAVGLHFVPHSYHGALAVYSNLTEHLVSKHDKNKNRLSRTEECFTMGTAASFTPHDFIVKPKDVANAECPFQTVRRIADVKDKNFGPLRLYTIMQCDPYDRFWYGKENGTPRSKVSDVNKSSFL